MKNEENIKESRYRDITFILRPKIDASKGNICSFSTQVMEGKFQIKPFQIIHHHLGLIKV